MSAVANVTETTESLLKVRRSSISNHPSVFAEIYEEDVNIAIWQRKMSAELQSSINRLLENSSAIQETVVVTAANAYETLLNLNHAFENSQVLCRDIAELVEMYSLLLDVQQVGLRLASLDRAMCPRFHVDRVLCRLVCTYSGVATEWLAHDKVDHSKRGRGSNGLADEESGLFQNQEDINQLNAGDVALLKGELWPDNGYAGLVHRSPQVSVGENRLLLTFDPMN